MMVIKFNDKVLRLDGPCSGNERMLSNKLATHLFELSKTVDNPLSLLQRLACFQCICHGNLIELILNVDNNVSHETNVWSHIKPIKIDNKNRRLNNILPLINKNQSNDIQDDEFDNEYEEGFYDSLEPCVADIFITYNELWKYVNEHI